MWLGLNCFSWQIEPSSVHLVDVLPLGINLHMVLEGHKIREVIPGHLLRTLVSLVAQIVKNLPAMLETQV